MEKYLVADSYQNGEQVGSPITKDGKQYITVKMRCPRCGGSGIYGGYIENGRCFRCGGCGYEKKVVRIYTESEYAALERQKEKARERKEQERQQAREEGIRRRHEYIVKFGFDEDENVYVVYGGDTFAIKDQLKAMGAKFNNRLKWYFSAPVELPEGYSLVAINFDEICEYSPITRYIDFKMDSITVIKEKIEAASLATLPSDYYPAEIKERIRDLEVTFVKWHSFAGSYGTTFVYTFTLDTYTFVWMSTKLLPEFQRGQKVILTGTIKSFDIYEGIKVTYLTRCVVKEEI